MSTTADRRPSTVDKRRLDVLARAVLSNSQEPKARAISRAISDLIERGFWRPGDKLPTEKELGALLGVSMGTVQTAMRSLTSSGLVDRRRGSGSFVSQSHTFGGTILHFRFRRPGGEGLVPWEADVKSIDAIREQGPWSEFLSQSISFIRVCRTVRVDNALTLWSEVYVDGERFRPLLDLSLPVLSTKNLRVFLHERYNAPTFRMVHHVRCREISSEHARLIGCPAGISGLELKAFGYSYRDSPLIFQRIIIPPTDMELEILG